MMLILKKNGDKKLKDAAWDDLKHGLISSVTPGFRKEVKEEMQEKGVGGTKDQLAKEEKTRLTKRLDKWEESISNFFDV